MENTATHPKITDQLPVLKRGHLPPTSTELADQLAEFDSVFEQESTPGVVTTDMLTTGAIRLTDAFNALTVAIAKMSEKP